MKRSVLGLLLAVVSVAGQPVPREIAPAEAGKVEAVAVQSKIRINRIVIFSENGAAGIFVMRERQHLDADGKVVLTDRLPMIRRDLVLAPGETVTDSAGRQVTLDQVLGLLNQFAAKWAAEDEGKK